MRGWALEAGGTAVSAGSDIKQAGDVEGVCALCLHDGPLLLSHIEPKWAFKAMKDEGGGVRHHPSVPGGPSNRMQDGYKHYLLCAECEQYLGQGERALSLVSQASLIDLRQAQLEVQPSETGRYFHLVGEDRTLVQRALLGLALKYHYSPSAEFEFKPGNIVQQIRKAILADDYTDLGAPSATKWFDVAESGAPAMNPRSVTVTQFHPHVPGKHAAALMQMLGGMTWLTPLHAGASQQDFADWSAWAIVPGPLRRNELLFDDARQLGQFGLEGLPEQFDQDAPCPCGMDRTTQACCGSTWLQSFPSAPRD